MLQNKITLAAAGLAVTASVYLAWRALKSEEPEPEENEPVRRESTRTPVDFDVLAKAVRYSNPQLRTVLQYLLEQSPFLEKQRQMDRSGCFTNISVVFQESTVPQIRILCYKIFANISTNPALVKRYIEPLLPEIDTDFSTEERQYLPYILNLYVNLSSMENAQSFSYNLRLVPQILSRYTHEINYHFEIVLSSLKILVNMTVEEIPFDTSLVYMSAIHLLHSCQSGSILLRVLTLLRNMLDSVELWEGVFEEEVARGVGVVIAQCPDEQCIALANHIYNRLARKE